MKIYVGLLFLTCTLCVGASASALGDDLLPPGKPLIKRARTFVCDPDEIPRKPFDEFWPATSDLVNDRTSTSLRQQFQTLTNMCTSYPAGLGMFCREDGTKDRIRPLSATSQRIADFPHPWAPEGPHNQNPGPWIRSQNSWCQACACLDIAPEKPDPMPAARPACVDVEEEVADAAILPGPTEAGAAASPDTSPAVVSPGNGAAASTNQCPPTVADQSGRDSFTAPACSLWYGEPVLQDCQEAVRLLHDYAEAHKQSDDHGYDLSYDSDPESEAAADAWYEVFAPEAPHDLNFVRLGDFARVQQKWPRITFIPTPLTFSEGACTITVLPSEAGDPLEDLVVNGAMIDMPRDTSTSVVEQCVATRGKGGYALTGYQFDYETPWPLAIHVYHPESQFKKLLDVKFACDVDAKGNIVCHDIDEEPPKKKPKPDDGSRWGAGVGDPGQGSSRSGQATSVPGAPAADSISAPQCGGRCRHWDDCRGSHCRCGRSRVNPVDRTNALTCHQVPTVAQAIDDIKPLGTLCSRGRCLLTETNYTINSNATTNTTNSNATNDEAIHLEIVTAPNATMPTLGEGVLECVCNCTYVSPACCFVDNGIVWEPLIAWSTEMMVPAVDNSTCCDSTTGKWRNGTTVQDDGNTFCSI